MGSPLMLTTTALLYQCLPRHAQCLLVGADVHTFYIYGIMSSLSYQTHNFSPAPPHLSPPLNPPPPVSQPPHHSVLIIAQFFCSLNVVRFIAYVGEQGFAEMGTYWRESGTSVTGAPTAIGTTLGPLLACTVLSPAAWASQ